MDRLNSCGGFLSLACAVHCALTPLILVALPVAGLEFLAEESLEFPLALASVGFVLAGLRSGYREHRCRSLVLMIGAGIALVFSARFLAEDAFETASMISGGLILALGAWMNHLLCRSCHKRR